MRCSLLILCVFLLLSSLAPPLVFSTETGLIDRIRTKLGGTLFDTTSPSSPFIMLMAFYIVLFVATLATGAVQAGKAKIAK